MTIENLNKLLIAEGMLDVEPELTAEDILNQIKGGQE
jgi:hypothetical protein